MRQFTLIAAMLLMSASVQAESPRGLSLASDQTAAVEQPKLAEAPNAETPKPAERASANETVSDQPNADQAAGPDRARPDRVKSVSNKTDKPKAKRDQIETRVIDELHRHGIYW